MLFKGRESSDYLKHVICRLKALVHENMSYSAVLNLPEIVRLVSDAFPFAGLAIDQERGLERCGSGLPKRGSDSHVWNISFSSG